MGKRIFFYHQDHDYGEFSNFAAFPLELKGKKWPTSEHYFQAQKFAGTGYEDRIRKAKTPLEAARMGRDRSRPLRRDWEKVKDNVMYDVLKRSSASILSLRNSSLKPVTQRSSNTRRTMNTGAMAATAAARTCLVDC